MFGGAFGIPRSVRMNEISMFYDQERCLFPSQSAMKHHENRTSVGNAISFLTQATLSASAEDPSNPGNSLWRSK